MATIQGEAICVRHWDWSETSQTVSLLTREHGLLRCLAKGAKREKAPFSGGLEIATLGHMVALVKPSSDLALLTAWDLRNPMYAIRNDLSRYHAAMYAIDLVPRMINDHDPHPEIYEALRETLDELGALNAKKSHDIARLMVWYQWQLLVATGAKPELRVDVVSGDRLEPGMDIYGFHAIQGGLTEDPQDTGLSEHWRVRRSTVDLLRMLEDGALCRELNQEEPAALSRSGALLAVYIRSLIGTEVRSARLVYPGFGGG